MPAGYGATMRQLDVEEVRDLLSSGARVQLVDCREAWETEICRLQGAIHIPLGEVTERALEELDRGVPVVVYCHAGVRSINAAILLERLGCEAASMRGGIEAWSLRVDPRVPRY